MMVALTKPVVLVQGMNQWAPSGAESSDTEGVRVHAICEVARRARCEGSESFNNGDVFSPRRQTPQNVQQAVAQTAASNGSEMSRDCASTSRWRGVIGGRGGRKDSEGACAIAFRLNRFVSGLFKPLQGNSWMWCHKAIAERTLLSLDMPIVPVREAMKACR